MTIFSLYSYLILLKRKQYVNVNYVYFLDLVLTFKITATWRDQTQFWKMNCLPSIVERVTNMKVAMFETYCQDLCFQGTHSASYWGSILVTSSEASFLQYTVLSFSVSNIHLSISIPALVYNTFTAAPSSYSPFEAVFLISCWDSASSLQQLPFAWSPGSPKPWELSHTDGLKSFFLELTLTHSRCANLTGHLVSLFAFLTGIWYSTWSNKSSTRWEVLHWVSKFSMILCHSNIKHKMNPVWTVTLPAKGDTPRGCGSA